MKIKRLVIPHELMDLNRYVNAERSNRFQAAKIKKENTYRCAVAIKAAMNEGLKIYDEELPLDFRFRWYVPNKRKDKDNIAFAKKFILDGMLQSGLIENDGWKQVGNFKDEFYVDKENPRVVIELVTRTE